MPKGEDRLDAWPQGEEALKGAVSEARYSKIDDQGIRWPRGLRQQPDYLRKWPALSRSH